MKNRMIAVVLLCCLPLGCAFVSEKAKMEQYGRILDTYETAMRLSDFNALCQFVDPLSMPRHVCLKQFGEIKIVDYRVVHVEVSEDRSKVRHEVEVDYFLLDRYVMKTIGFQQSWIYHRSSRNWLLQNGPPRFR